MRDQEQELEEAKKELQRLHSQVRSLVMATVGIRSTPRVSYAPYLKAPSGYFYVYLSRLSAHTLDLMDDPVASIMLVEDESEAGQIFARTRVTYLCKAEVIDRKDSGYERILDRFTQRFGNTVDLLRSLPDFVLFELRPRDGRFVMGFGRAYDLEGDRFDRLVHVGPDQINRPKPGTVE